MRNKVRPQVVLLAAALPFVLSACTSGPLSVEHSPTPPAPISASASNTASAEASTVGSSDDPLDNGGYAEYTWDDHVASMRKMSGLTSWPEVERIRFISPEERPEVQAKCLTSLGFPTTVESGDSYETLGMPEQQEALAEATYTCDLQYPTDLRYAQAFTRTQLKTIYAYFRDDLIPCLQGLELESSPLPSEETFVEGTASGTAPWTPYDDLNLDTVDITAMNQTCPGMPASDVLYGS